MAPTQPDPLRRMQASNKVQGMLLLRWKKRGIEPEDSTATNFEVVVVRLGDEVSVVGRLDGRPFDMTASTTTGLRIKHTVFREGREIVWNVPINRVSFKLSETGKAFVIRFGETVPGKNDGAYRILEGSVIACEE